MTTKINIPSATISANDLYERGRELEQEAHQALEGGKLGTLRGGNTGCVTETGEVYGKCHRLSFARMKGYQTAITAKDTFAWFDAGYANEEAWMMKLSKSVADMGEGYVLKSEEECPIRWEANGVKVTGRPDIMVFKDDKPVLGLELKCLNAAKSAAYVLCGDAPKTDNLLQAAHYSMAMNCPFTLVYSYRGRSRLPWREEKRFADQLHKTVKAPPRQKRDGSWSKEWAEYTLEPNQVKEFKIGFEDDKVYYIKEDGTRVDTIFTASGIRRYYEMVADMDKDSDLFHRVTQLDLNGKSLPYDPCNYCVFKDACDNFENDMESWLDKVALICEESKND